MYMQSNQILNSEDHANFLRKNEKNPADYRPDIIHQALLSILDSPVNKAGRLQSVYVRTEKGVLFEVKPHVRIPSTYKRFAGIMLHLLQKLSITAVSKGEKLLHVIKNPVTQYLPLNSQRIGLSYGSEKLVKMKDYVKAIDDDTYLVFVVCSKNSLFFPPLCYQIMTCILLILLSFLPLPGWCNGPWENRDRLY
ncbi:hypothetical protein SLEP1_g49186 [Rubroshorea leprosula]|uniref:Ribosomal RNA small subunit methyltransferase NEP1 n=1 Tax=Rubroshorea leprosula TaxID=152421 RepID=A0AAV5LYA0_9ROSI|nr:hypothetical protein SLEP1_g49186 [Rubroshorea leprosula]